MTRHERQARSAPRIDLRERLARPASLRGRVHALGALALIAYASMTALSFVQAAALWRHRVRGGDAGFLRGAQRPAPSAAAIYVGLAPRRRPF